MASSLPIVGAKGGPSRVSGGRAAGRRDLSARVGSPARGILT